MERASSYRIPPQHPRLGWNLLALPVQKQTLKGQAFPVSAPNKGRRNSREVLR